MQTKIILRKAVSAAVTSAMVIPSLFSSLVLPENFVKTALAADSFGCDYYASPTGVSGNSGTEGSPWDLQSALNKTTLVTAGKTLCLKGGTYVGNWTATLKGNSGSQIVVKSKPGEWAKLDGNSPSRPQGRAILQDDVGGSQYVTYRDFEITHSNPQKVSTCSNFDSNCDSSAPSDINTGDAIYTQAPGNKYINMVIHDVPGNGIGLWGGATNSEVAGTIIYHVGWSGPAGSRNHGHGIYTQSDPTGDARTIRDIISFKNHEANVKLWNAGGRSVNNYTLSKNVVFNGGEPGRQDSTSERGANLFAGRGGQPGDYQPITGLKVQDNNFYQEESKCGYSNNTNGSAGYVCQPIIYVGYGDDAGSINNDVTIQRNNIVGGNTSVRVHRFKAVNFTNNFIATNCNVAPIDARLNNASVTANFTWDNNSYFCANTSSYNYSWPFVLKKEDVNLVAPWSSNAASTTAFLFYISPFFPGQDWKGFTGFDANSRFFDVKNSNPVNTSGTAADKFKDIVNPNPYETGRANVIIYNFEGRTSYSLDLSRTGLTAGQQYEIRDVQNYFGTPLATGTYSGSGSVTLPLNATTVSTALGNVLNQPTHTPSEFNAFVVVPVYQANTGSSSICDYYASTTGLSTNTGSSSSPWDLATALGKTTTVVGGKTLCLKGGKYTGRFFSSLSGSAGSLVTVRSAPGEWAIIDSNASYTLIEAMDATSGADRNTPVACKFSFGTSLPPQSNLVVDNEVLRIFNYNNGYTTCYRGQNSSSSATTPIVAHSAGALAESDQAALTVNGSYVDFRNFEVTNSKLPRVTPYSRNQSGAHFANSLMPGSVEIFAPNSKFVNILVQNAGSGLSFWTGATNSELYGNIMYHNGWISPARGHGHNIYSQNNSTDVNSKKIKDNILFGGFSAGVQIYGSSAAGILGGYTIEGNLQMDDHDSMYSDLDGFVHNTKLDNNYAYGKDSFYSISAGTNVSQANNYELYWETSNPAKKLKINGAQQTVPTTGQSVKCLPTSENGSVWKRVLVYNYDSTKTSYDFDPTCLGLSSGQEYEIYDIQNIKGGANQTFSPFAKFTYSGSNITLPLNLTAKQSIVGYDANTVIPPTASDLANLPTLTHTSNEFNGFLIVPSGSFGTTTVQSPPAPSASFDSSAYSVTNGDSLSIGFSTSNGSTASISPAISGCTVNVSQSNQTCTINLSATTTYTLSVTSSTGVTTTATTTVTVNPASNSYTCDFYAATNGLSTNSGLVSSPWDLQTALNKTSQVNSGKTLCLKGGTYSGNYSSNLSGSSGSLVTVRSAPNEWAVIDGYKIGTLSSPLSASVSGNGEPCGLSSTDYKVGDKVLVEDEFLSIYTQVSGTLYCVRGIDSTSPVAHASGAPVKMFDVALTVNGSYVTFRDFEITNSHPLRVVGDWATNSKYTRGGGLAAYASNSKFVNLVIHDTAGVGFWTPSTNSVLEGNIIYNTGVDADDRGHDHSIYTQNATPTKTISGNIMFNSFGFGIHAYTEGGNIDNFIFKDNVSFNAGYLSTKGNSSEFLLGGAKVNNNNVVRNNYTYNGNGLNVGYYAGCSNAVIEDNYLTAGFSLTSGSLCLPVSMTGNTFLNTFGLGQPTGGFNTSSYPTNSYLTAKPSTNKVSVLPLSSTVARGHVVVYNWTNSTTQSVDLSSILAAGDSYEIRDAQNFLGTPILSGTYSGGNVTVTLPDTSSTVAQPIGNAPKAAVHTSKEFNVFVVCKTSCINGGSVVTPVAPNTPTISPNGGTYTTTSGNITLSSTTSGVTIYYTLDGSDPVSSGTRSTYTSPFAVTSTKTLKVTAFANGLYSPVGSATFTINPSAVIPTASFASSAYSVTSGSQVTIGFSTSLGVSASISPTIPGCTPTAAQASQTCTFTPSSTTTYTLSVTSSTNDTATSTTTVTVNTPSSPSAPVVNPSGGTFTGSTTAITITCPTAGAAIYYTLDGSDPVTSGTRLTYASSFTLSTTKTVKAVAYFNSLYSSVTNASFIVSASDVGFSQYIEAETATLNGSVTGLSVLPNMKSETVGSDTYIFYDADPSNQANRDTGPTGKGGSAKLTFTIPTTSSYYMWARVKSDDSSSDSVFVMTDNNTTGDSDDLSTVDVYDTSENYWTPAGFKWTRVVGRSYNGGSPVSQADPVAAAPRVFSFDAGSRTITLIGRDPKTLLDKFFITSNPTQVPSDVVPVIPSASFASSTYSVTSGNSLTIGFSTSNGATASISPTISGCSVNANQANQTCTFTPASSTTYTLTVTSSTSDTATASTVVTVNVPPSSPTISPNGGSFTDATGNITLASSTGGATVYYTTDDTDPISSVTRTTYSSPFALTTSKTVKAVSFLNSLYSSVTSASFTVTPSPVIPTASFVSNAYSVTSGNQTTIGFSTALGVSASISPAISGCTPNAAQTGQTCTFTPSSTTTYTLTVTSSTGHTTTATTTVTVNVAPNAPTISPNGGTFTATTGNITLASSTSGATIYYTTDGSSPTSAGTRTTYTTPFALTTSKTVKAAAYANGLYSTVTSAVFTVNASTTGFSQYIEAETATRNGTVPGLSVQANMKSGTVGSTTYIYYDADETNSANRDDSLTGKGGSAKFSVAIPNTATYYMWARVKSDNSNTDSFWVTTDNNTPDTSDDLGTKDVYDTAENYWTPAGFKWTRVVGRNYNGGNVVSQANPAAASPRLFKFSKGTRTFTFFGRDPKTLLDQIFITTDPAAVPTGGAATVTPTAAFAAGTYSVTSGNSVTIGFSTGNGATASISPTVPGCSIAVSQSNQTCTFTPTVSGTYTLSVTSSSGDTATATTALTVSGVVPIIASSSFAAGTYSVTSGNSVTIGFSTGNGATASISPTIPGCSVAVSQSNQTCTFMPSDSATYTLTVTSSTGNVSTSTTVITVASAGFSKYIEAESGTLNASVSGLTVLPNMKSATSGGITYVYYDADETNSVNVDSAPTGKGGSLKLSFSIPTTKTYYMWARVQSDNSSTDSVWVMTDNNTPDTSDDLNTKDIYDTSENYWSTTGFKWTRIVGRNYNGGNVVSQANPIAASPRYFKFSAGTRTVSIIGRDPKTLIDKVFITSDPNAVPTDTVTVTPVYPTAVFASSTYNVTSGNSTTITFSTSNGVTASITPSISGCTVNAGLLNQTCTFTPSSTQTYTLSVTSSTGHSANATTTVNVTAPAAPIAPTITPNGGSFADTTGNITLSSATSGSIIYYTIDDTDPTTSSTRLIYSSAFALTTSKTVKAVAYKNSLYSSVSSASFTVTVTPIVPTASFVASSYSVAQGNSLSIGFSTGNGTTVSLTPAISGCTVNANQSGQTCTFNPSSTTTYTLKVTSSTGNIATATTTVTVTPGVVAKYIEAESGVLNGNVNGLTIISNMKTGIEGAVTYVYYDADPLVSGNRDDTPTGKGGSLKISFSIPTTQTYYIWAKVKSDDSNTDSVWVMSDNNTPDTSDDINTKDIYDTSEDYWSTTGFKWTRVVGRNYNGGNVVSQADPVTATPRSFRFSAGTRSITIIGRDPQTLIDKVFITSDPNAVPTN